MINDKILDEFLTSTTVIQPQGVVLAIGNAGENLVNWQLQFNRLSMSEMYNEYKNIVNQLIVVKIDESLRLSLMDKVFKIASRMFVSLKQVYQNQTGFLNENQQQALDTVLSSYYLTIMFYYTVWQRAATTPVIVEKKGLTSLLNRQSENVSDTVIKESLYGMMSLLRESLYEKYLGYRRDIGVIWKYLNRCYRFIRTNEWQNFKGQLSGIYGGKVEPTLQQIYYQCLLAHIINPYACRRPDLIALDEKSLIWIDKMVISAEQAQRPFLFVDLLSDEPPQLQHAGIAFNPFAKGNECIFINVEPLQQRLQQIIDSARASQSIESRMMARHAQIISQNIRDTLEPPVNYAKSQEKCQAVVGFHHIHYMLANKSSLSNLIQAHTLPERLRPRAQNTQQLNQMTAATIVGTANNHRHLAHKFSYKPFEMINHSQQIRSAEYTQISQFQVQSLIAIRLANDSSKVWQLGRVNSIQQTPVKLADDVVVNGVQTAAIDLEIDAWLTLFGTNIVPCGVRLQNSGSRPPHFVPALIIPNNPGLGHHQTSLMMSRFGYNVDDKLIIRIDSKEVNICLTELLNLTDDVEEYAFVRIQ